MNEKGMYISTEAAAIAGCLSMGVGPARGDAGLLEQVRFIYRYAALGTSPWAHVELIGRRNVHGWYYEYIVVDDGEPEP